MSQLKMKDILLVVQTLKEQGMSVREIGELVVYIGDDEELNGIHAAYYAEHIDSQSESGAAYAETIVENCTNPKFPGKAILIS